MISPTDLTRPSSTSTSRPTSLASAGPGRSTVPSTRVELRVARGRCRPTSRCCVWTLARAHFDDGGEQDYQLFVGVRPAVPAPDFLHGKERELIADGARPAR